jgi:6-pyruvoyltetrahydropterin/6-carboxytetrahydropterin synthase
MFTLRKSFSFEAAHRLPYVPESHKCARLHGHSFQVEVFVRGEIESEIGWVIDYGEITAQVNPWIEKLDHYYLNEIPGLENPTSEILCAWLWEGIAPELPGLYCISIAETCTVRCDYYGPRLKTPKDIVRDELHGR